MSLGFLQLHDQEEALHLLSEQLSNNDLLVEADMAIKVMLVSHVAAVVGKLSELTVGGCQLEDCLRYIEDAHLAIKDAESLWGAPTSGLTKRDACFGFHPQLLPSSMLAAQQSNSQTMLLTRCFPESGASSRCRLRPHWHCVDLVAGGHHRSSL